MQDTALHLVVISPVTLGCDSFLDFPFLQWLYWVFCCCFSWGRTYLDFFSFHLAGAFFFNLLPVFSMSSYSTFPTSPLGSSNSTTPTAFPRACSPEDFGFLWTAALWACCISGFPPNFGIACTFLLGPIPYILGFMLSSFVIYFRVLE